MPPTEPRAVSVPRVKAHRGSSGTAPENTRAALELAFQEEADATEIDVRISKDGVVVMFHDEDTARIGGRPRKVAEQTLAELRELDIGAWKGPSFAGQRILTLVEVLRLLPRGKILFVEIKDGTEAVPAVLRAIDNSPHRDQVGIESFSLGVLLAVQKAAPALPLHWTLAPKKDSAGRPLALPIALVEQAREAGFAGLSVDVHGLSPAFVEAARAAELELAVWTINDAAVAAQLAALPITWIETDLPAMVRATLADRNTRP